MKYNILLFCALLIFMNGCNVESSSKEKDNGTNNPIELNLSKQPKIDTVNIAPNKNSNEPLPDYTVIHENDNNGYVIIPEYTNKTSQYDLEYVARKISESKGYGGLAIFNSKEDYDAFWDLNSKEYTEGFLGMYTTFPSWSSPYVTEIYNSDTEKLFIPIVNREAQGDLPAYSIASINEFLDEEEKPYYGDIIIPSINQETSKKTLEKIARDIVNVEGFTDYYPIEFYSSWKDFGMNKAGLYATEGWEVPIGTERYNLIMEYDIGKDEVTFE